MFHGCPFEVILNEISIALVMFDGLVVYRHTKTKFICDLCDLFGRYKENVIIRELIVRSMTCN